VNHTEVLAGCEPWSHSVGADSGAVVIHGFTGCPGSVRGLADALALAGLDIELPRLPGHGTAMEEMLETRWHHWLEVAESAYQRLASRVETVVLVGQSMGATLALALAQRHPEVRGVVCINPVTQLRDADTMAMIAEYIDDGITVVPGEGSDIADPDSFDIAYSGTPLAPLQSMLIDGVGTLTNKFTEMVMPLRLFTSRQDHVVDPSDSEYLASAWGGPVEHTWLERSFHVATRDFDRELVHDRSVAFVRSLT
jgi:carboxylesterase